MAQFPFPCPCQVLRCVPRAHPPAFPASMGMVGSCRCVRRCLLSSALVAGRGCSAGERCYEVGGGRRDCWALSSPTRSEWACRAHTVQPGLAPAVLVPARCALPPSPPPQVVAEAVASHASLIVTYHPTPFGGLKRLVREDRAGRAVLACARAGIAVYSPHTALDSVSGGINDWLAAGVLGLPFRWVAARRWWRVWADRAHSAAPTRCLGSSAVGWMSVAGRCFRCASYCIAPFALSVTTHVRTR